jgi:hypothetical protein
LYFTIEIQSLQEKDRAARRLDFTFCCNVIEYSHGRETAGADLAGAAKSKRHARPASGVCFGKEA